MHTYTQAVERTETRCTTAAELASTKKELQQWKDGDLKNSKGGGTHVCMHYVNMCACAGDIDLFHLGSNGCRHGRLAFALA